MPLDFTTSVSALVSWCPFYGSILTRGPLRSDSVRWTSDADFVVAPQTGLNTFHCQCLGEALSAAFPKFRGITNARDFFCLREDWPENDGVASTLLVYAIWAVHGQLRRSRLFGISEELARRLGAVVKQELYENPRLTEVRHMLT